jgi:RNA polymerase sigma-70 factor (ECF subfamily)
MPDASDTQLQRLIDRMNAGDLAARDALIGRSCDRLLQLTRTMLKDFRRVRTLEESGDITQKAAIRLQNALNAVPIESVAGFFRLAALQIRRELLDAVRRMKKMPTPKAEPPAAATDSTALPENELSDSTFDPVRLAFWQSFHEQVEQLPEKEREAFSLIWYLELSHAEAAAALKTSVPSVKRRMYRAREKLRQFLK